jgi:hypothetical protein
MTTTRATPILALGLAVAIGPGVLGLPSMTRAASEEAATEPLSLSEMAPGILERVERIRGLEALVDVPIRTVDPQVSASEQLAAITPDDLAQLRADEILLTRLGFLPEGFDLLDALQTLASEGVAGYYRPEQGDIAIVDADGVPDAFAPWVVAHEYVHALQDQHHDIEATIDSRPQGDAQTAVTALVEGDATLLMTALAMSDALSGTSTPVPDDQTALEMDASDLGSMPPMLNRELLFPYLDGLYFAQRMWGRGGWDNVEAVWADPPRSTEQIMHPERYPDDQPITIELPDVAGLLGKGWTTGPGSTMGELRLSILAAGNEDHEIPLLPLAGIRLPNAEAAEGWGGDRVVTADGPRGAWVVAWQTAWDTPADAAEFAAAAREAMPGWADTQAVLEGVSVDPAVADDQGVLLLTADDSDTLRKARRALVAG